LSKGKGNNPVAIADKAQQSAGFGLGRPASHIVFHGKLQVRLRFLVKLAVKGVPPKTRLCENPPAAPPAHTR
jgi:hypothetical protein